MWRTLGLMLLLSLFVGSTIAQVSQSQNAEPEIAQPQDQQPQDQQPQDQQPQDQQPQDQQPQDQQPQDQPSSKDPIRRGQYLVHHVAKCVECHSPRNSQGRLIPQRLLQGAPIPVESPYPDMEWAFEAPQIAGLPGFAPETVETLLQTGRRPGGRTPRAPMPTFHMTPEDARAVVAYLMSL